MIAEKKLKEQARISKNLLNANRVDFIAPADYRINSELHEKTCLLLDYVIAKIRYALKLKI